MDPSLFGQVMTTKTDISRAIQQGTSKRPRGLNLIGTTTDISNDNASDRDIDIGIFNNIESYNVIRDQSSKNEENHINKKSKITSASSTEKAKKNKYTGWTVPLSNYQIPAISLTSGADDIIDEDQDDAGGHNMTAQRFYKEYINKRRPVVLRSGSGNHENLLQEFEEILNKWKPSNEDLKQRAGNERVMVEVRSNEKGAFGKGCEASMSFGKFCNKQEGGDTMHYLTTQDVEVNDEGRPELMAPFMKKLRVGNDNSNDGCANDKDCDNDGNHTANDDSGKFPLRPKLMGNLVPQNINIWMGNTSKQHGTSSGLHHDYHDNFYIMVRGRKRFRLYSPADTEKMYTRGKLQVVHPNGRINYEGDETTAYGADVGAHAAAKASEAKDDAERKLVQAEEAVAEGRAGAHAELERAEELLEEAMEALIDAEMSENDDGSFGDDDDGIFEEGNDEENYDGSLGDDDYGSFEEGNDEENDDDDFGDDDTNDEYSKDNSDKKNSCLNEREEEKSNRLADKTVKNPDNFSKIEAHLLDNKAKLAIQFPDILNAKPAFCDVNAGDILYLPASWFHEVTSFGDQRKIDNTNDGHGGEHDNGHLALNYWFHPPDADNNFEQPYSTDFWPNDYKMRFTAKHKIQTP